MEAIINLTKIIPVAEGLDPIYIVAIRTILAQMIEHLVDHTQLLYETHADTDSFLLDVAVACSVTKAHYWNTDEFRSTLTMPLKHLSEKQVLATAKAYEWDHSQLTDPIHMHKILKFVELFVLEHLRDCDRSHITPFSFIDFDPTIAFLTFKGTISDLIEVRNEFYRAIKLKYAKHCHEYHIPNTLHNEYCDVYPKNI